MGKFDRAKGAQGIKEVAKESNEKANLLKIVYYKDEELLDYPKNNEDVTYTEDIEKSITEQGFTDPIEITDFGCEEGKRMIISGHRRRMAGRRRGMKEFPCILRHFKSEHELRNYVLFSNSHRDSAKDPLLLVARYKMHEEYLKEINFKGSIREEVAGRLGLRPAQADRYNQMNKVIFPIWDMIRAGTVGMSNITDSGLYTHTPEEQGEILKIMNECLDTGTDLTRTIVKKIVEQYRNGKRSWVEVIQNEMNFMNQPDTAYPNVQAGVSVMSVNTEPAEKQEGEHSPLERNNEVNYDFSHREGLPSGSDPLANERLTEEDMQAIEKNIHNEEKEKKEPKPELTNEEKKAVAGEKIMKHLSGLEGLLNDFYTFNDVGLALRTMGATMKLIAQEMESVASEYSMEEEWKKQLEGITRVIQEFE